MTDVRARLAAVALVLLAIWEVTVVLRAGRSAPSDADWQAVAAAIPAALAPDQLIVFAPQWIDPVGRRWLGSRLSIGKAARMDAVRYRDVWEVSGRGASAPDVAAESPVSEQTFGPIRVRRFSRDAPAVTWSLDEGVRVCEVDFQPRLGMVLDVHHAFAQAVREFRQVRLGNELQVYAGLDDVQRRSRNRSTALIQVIVDGREVTRGLAGNDDAWVALPAAATAEGEHDVQIVVRAGHVDGPIDLGVCIAAEARERRR